MVSKSLLTSFPLSENHLEKRECALTSTSCARQPGMRQLPHAATARTRAHARWLGPRGTGTRLRTLDARRAGRERLVRCCRAAPWCAFEQIKPPPRSRRATNQRSVVG